MFSESIGKLSVKPNLGLKAKSFRFRLKYSEVLRKTIAPLI
jgi:hypothetical protein